VTGLSSAAVFSECSFVAVNIMLSLSLGLAVFNVVSLKRGLS